MSSGILGRHDFLRRDCRGECTSCLHEWIVRVLFIFSKALSIIIIIIDDVYSFYNHDVSCIYILYRTTRSSCVRSMKKMIFRSIISFIFLSTLSKKKVCIVRTQSLERVGTHSFMMIPSEAFERWHVFGLLGTCGRLSSVCARMSNIISLMMLILTLFRFMWWLLGCMIISYGYVTNTLVKLVVVVQDALVKESEMRAVSCSTSLIIIKRIEYIKNIMMMIRW
jgi:hypothetical protein